jgi:hypothetical protein
VSNNIEGAPGPLLIHTDKSKTKGKEAEEREKQRNGETPTQPELANRFKENIDHPEVVVSSTHSGSMTQEMFYLFAEHFIKSLPKESGPIILLLDGHGSRWSVPALQLLMANKIYPFFIASHTSIWAQPNDAGVNKRFHWAMEQAAKQSCRAAGIANVAYFNEIFVRGWRIFLETERSEIRQLGFNNTTNSYERTGMKPFDPFATAWNKNRSIPLQLLGQTPLKHWEWEPCQVSNKKCNMRFTDCTMHQHSHLQRKQSYVRVWTLIMRRIRATQPWL